MYAEKKEKGTYKSIIIGMDYSECNQYYCINYIYMVERSICVTRRYNVRKKGNVPWTVRNIIANIVLNLTLFSKNLNINAPFAASPKVIDNAKAISNTIWQEIKTKK